MANHELLAQTFVELADTLVDSYDLIDFLHLLTDRCGALLGVAEAGVVLADPRGALRVLASSSERMRSLELFEVQNHDGPCLDTWHTGEITSEPDLAGAGVRRWPRFGPAAAGAGVRAVDALPMRLRENRIGALNLFADVAGGLSPADLNVGQALADVASIGIVHERFARDQSALTDQLQLALNSRVCLEQAKGMVSEQATLDMDASFQLLRGYARHHRRRLGDVVADVLERRIDAERLHLPEATTPEETEPRPSVVYGP
jgi:hypothetical protein